jgi:hypothetical protein
MLERERGFSTSRSAAARLTSRRTAFQGNCFLVSELFADVVAEALAAPGTAPMIRRPAFAGALAEAGHRVVSAEADAEAVGDARRTRERWDDGEGWEIVGPITLARFLQEDDRRFACVVADPPRTGLGTELAADLARRSEKVFVYVSCDPATLARDLPAILAEGFRIRNAKLYDLFALTHRVEALVALERAA